MNKAIFDCYNDFIARVVIDSCGRASCYRSKRENCGDSENKSERNPEHNRMVQRPKC